MPGQWAMILLVGLGAGVLSGMFGIGGGIVIVPALILLLGFSVQQAAGTSLAALLLPVSSLAVIAYYRAGKLKIVPAALIAGGLIFGATAGAQLALNTSGKTLKGLYGFFLLYIAWRFIEPRRWIKAVSNQRSAVSRQRSAVGNSAPVEPQHTVSLPTNTTGENEGARDVPWWVLLLVGLGAGVLAGLFGIGGGVVIVPVLVTLLRFDQKQAVATSLAALLPPVGLGAVISYYNAGMLDVSIAALMAGGLLFGALAGARIALGLPSATIKRLYGLFLLVIGASFILEFVSGLLAR